MSEHFLFRDQMHRQISLPNTPRRIVSLVPSQTELLHYLGLEERVVGITKYCVHPSSWQQRKTIIGGTKRLLIDQINALQPDLIIGNKEENDQKQVELLMETFPVWMSDIKDLNGALEMIQSIGQLVDRVKAAEELVAAIRAAFAVLTQQLAGIPSKSVAYLIWRKPYMAAGGDTFIHDLLKQAGFSNVFSQQNRYPEISGPGLRELAPDCIFLSSEPFPFKEKHLTELQKLCPTSVIRLVDGELFSWYGNRLLHAAPYFLNLHRNK